MSIASGGAQQRLRPVCEEYIVARSQSPTVTMELNPKMQTNMQTRSMPIKRCLVTGASGFIGRLLCKSLQEQGIFVRALLRRRVEGPWDEICFAHLNYTSPEKNNLDNTSSILNTDNSNHNTINSSNCMVNSGYYTGNSSHSNNNLIDHRTVESLDTIFHLAGIAHASARSGTPRSHYWAVNVEATEKLMRLAAEAKIKRFIYFSSVKSMEEPSDDYGRSKRAAEQIVLELGKKYQIHVCILQPALVYGPNIKGNLFSMLRGIERGWFPPLPETHNKRSLVSVYDLIDAAKEVALNTTANGKRYVVTDGKGYSTKQLYDAMRDALGLRIRSWSIPLFVLKTAAKMGDLLEKISGKTLPLNSESLDKLLGSAVYSSNPIQEELNWKPKIDFYQALPEIVKTYKAATQG